MSSVMNVASVQDEQPISRTYQYRKVMKPMLERKRRARINRCLDELKELMSAALASEGENLTKLEKADVLELTVRHLHKLRDRQALGLGNNSSNAAAVGTPYADKFRAGYSHCAAEVSRYLSASSGLEVGVGQRLMSHLGRCVNGVDAPTTSALPYSAYAPSTYTPPTSPTLHHHHHHHQSVASLSPVSSPALSDADSTPCDYSKYSIRSDLYSPSNLSDNGKVWRPW